MSTEEILDAAELKNNIFTRTMVKVLYRAAYVVIYPVMYVKHILAK